MTNKLITFKAYKLILFLCSLQSFACWMFWGVSNLVFSVVLFIVSFAVISVRGLTLRTGVILGWFIVYILSFMLTQNNNLLGWLSFLMIAFNIYVLFVLNVERKHECYLYFRKGLAIIIGISCFGWLLYLLGVPLPHSYSGYGTSDISNYQYEFDNYYFFLLNRNTLFRYILPRFSSVFLEPGYLGCLMSVLLYADSFKLGKGHRENIVFLIALIMSFSLAGWLFAIMGLILSKISTSSKRIIWLVLFVIAIPTSSNFFRSYNKGNNIVNKAILLRLEYDSGAKTIAGYNRSSESIDYYFWNSFLYSDDLLWGDNNLLNKKSSNAENEVSWIGYIINYGLIAYILFSLYFFFPFLFDKKNRFFKFCIGLLFFMIFSQTVPMAHSLMYVSLLVLSIGHMNYLKLKFRK